MKKTISFILVVLTIGLCIIPFMSNAAYGTAASVKKNSSDVIADLKSEYSGSNVRNVTVTSGTETKLNTQNYDQTRLQNYYNSINTSAQLNGGGRLLGFCRNFLDQIQRSN